MSFKQIYALLRRSFPAPAQVIASGGALLRSKVWLQMMADAPGHPVVASNAAEASSRGAVLIPAEQMGFVDDLDATSSHLGETLHPKPARVRAYQRMLLRNEKLFEALHGRIQPLTHPSTPPRWAKRRLRFQAPDSSTSFSPPHRSGMASPAEPS